MQYTCTLQDTILQSSCRNCGPVEATRESVEADIGNTEKKESGREREGERERKKQCSVQLQDTGSPLKLELMHVSTEQHFRQLSASQEPFEHVATSDTRRAHMKINQVLHPFSQPS